MYFKKSFINVQKGIVLVVFAALAGCSGHEQSERDRLREQNAKGEYIYRHHHETQYPLTPPEHREAEVYPWESSPR